MRITLEFEPVTCCPGHCRDGCADCETHWSEMVKPGGIPSIDDEVRICPCGTFWTARECDECLFSVRRRSRAEDAPDAFREKAKDNATEAPARA